ncbi:MAG: HAMP domain-containing histidine kinase [Hyphomicrobiaceae bacterium]|nr:HAMP domain-containing histidine kinase [Hyphomicrobiaceae bacterium]
MAWTTSASLRVRPILWGTARTQTKYAAVLVRTLLRSLHRCHPSFALALPLVALGLLSPLLPYGLLAALLLTTCAAIANLSIPRTARDRAGQIQQAGPPLDCAVEQSSAQNVAFFASEIALERRAQRLAERDCAATRSHSANEQKNKNWVELMARVNHELRTPLNAVIGFSDMMALKLFGPVGDPRYEDYVRHIRDSANELLKSAEDTMALTALVAHPSTSDSSKTSELEELASEAWAFLSAKTATREIELELRIPAQLEILGEPRALRQILVNILSEGISRAGHGARITIAASVEEELVQLYFTVSKERRGSSRNGSSLAICLARALLEMQGSSLLEIECPVRGWGAVTVLDRAAQPDFFMDGNIASAHTQIPALVS